jgi:glucosyl-3-phosphoglycerate synthase
MESLSIPVGYGIELAVLVDTAAGNGLDAIAQVDLGSRGHKHQASHDLALMAAELLLVAERRRAGTARTAVTEQTALPGQAAARLGQPTRQRPVELRQFVRADGEMRQRSRPVPVHERPPARSVRIAPR